MKKTILQHLLIFLHVLICLRKGRCVAAIPNNINISTSHNRTHHIHDDESSLLAIKAHILLVNSDTILATNWSQGSPYCSWIGVRCGRRHPLRVTALNLSYMELQGTIPKGIGNLSFLSYLNIRNNTFSGTIPDTIRKLRRLRSLFISGNKLSGQIPPSIGLLRKLRVLTLYENELVGNIPSTLFNISSLQLVFLYGNQLSGTLPQDIGHYLPNLQYLDISENQLSGDIPLIIISLSSSCPQLKLLYLYANNFRGSIPVQIGNLSQLQTLSLGKNDLAGTIPTSITNLTNLEELDIGDGNLEGTIPSEIGHLSNLNWLSFGMNKLHGEVPPSIFNLSKLQQLELVFNNLSGEIPPSIDRSLPYLQVLFIGENSFRGIIPSSISNLSRLTHLSLRGNSFRGQIPITLGNLRQLQFISLGENQFKNNLSILKQDFLTPLTNCMHLKLIQFGLSPLITGELPRSLGSGNLSTTLEILVAPSCRINGKIPTEISNLTSLFWLNIGGNDLAGVIPPSLGSLTKLQLFGIYDNMLKGTMPQSFCNLKSLYLLHLRGNKLFGHLPSCLGNLSSLRVIYLINNAFNSNIPFASWFDGSIEQMYFGKNLFEGTLPRDIGNLNSLRELDLSENLLTGDNPESFSDLKHLQYLDLSYNNLSGTIPKSLERLSDLDYFNVSFNELTGEIPNEGPFKNFTPQCFIANKGLCGDSKFKVEACKLMKPKDPSSKRSLWRYILPPIASIFVAATIIFLIIRYRRKKSYDASFLSIVLPGLTQKRMSYYEIYHATNNFDGAKLIGRGSFGSVYKGEFSNAMIAAVKVFNLDVQGALKSFDMECRIMRNIRHRNLVKVITSCSNLEFKALVMEYMPNGNLEKWIHSTECSLNIYQRFGVMTDVAAAVEYLHHGYSTPIIHCDLKPNNILLNNDMVAHVGDFGIAKLLTGEQTMPQTKTLGTIGYMAPEYGSEGLVSTMVDVYSYGIILMEILTKRRPTAEMFSGELSMKKWVSDTFSNSLMQIVDVELLNTVEESVRDKQESCLTLIIELALECTAEVPEHRPTMKDVLVRVEKIKNQLHV